MRRPRARIPARLALLFVLPLAGAAPSRPEPAEDPAAAALARGRAALEAGEQGAAIAHFERALASRPDSLEILALCFAAAEGDADGRALWARALCAAAIDARGRTSLARELASELRAAAPEVEPLAAATVAAVDELEALATSSAKSARRKPESSIVAWWARELARRIARASPALRARLESDDARGIEAPPELASDVAKSLKRALSAELAGARWNEALRIARCVAGLGNQAASEDLQDEAPAGAAELESIGREALARARERLHAASEPWTRERLEELDERAALEFTRAHEDPASPGTGLSPSGLYRVETICGYDTLLGVLSTVEEHHRRLARWYGRDPFAGRPGLMRIEPEASGLESEGSPFWWAGGFQSGDLTVLRFACGTLPQLGRGIVHELTHRFDGALYPGLPAWLAEGRAVWTGGSYLYVESEEFVENAVAAGTIEAAFLKGYGGEAKLRELVEGELEDYRDNYVAGYALYVYLRSWEPQREQPFAARLDEYMRGVGTTKEGALPFFERHFADGRDGRPADFAHFAGGFATFLQGFYWETRAPWLSRYELEIADVASRRVLDEPTWTWSRARAEPFYGEMHAWEAARVLAALGRDEDALAAFAWGMSVEERRPQRARELSDFLARLGRSDAAWVLDNEARRHLRRAADELEAPAPFLEKLPRTRALAAELERAARASRAAGRELAACVLEGEHDELAAALGLELVAAAAPPPRAAASLRHPVHEPWRRLGLAGWNEAGLTDHEERRVPELWYADEAGDLHVGRERPRAGTGTLDRTAHQQDAFSLATDWMQPGRYRVRTRVQFTTSFVSGALVVGWTRRDRNLRVHFSAGDFMYAIGRKDEAEALEGVHWSLAGLRNRDGALAGSLASGVERFAEPRAHFALELVVDGPVLDVWIEGRRVGTYCTPDGMAIEGRIGFATSFGAIRAIAPEVQRIDATAALDPDPGSTAAPSALERLDLRGASTRPFEELVNRPVLGLAPDPRGALVIWIPAPELDAAGAEIDRAALLERARSLAERTDRMLERRHAAQPLALALPGFLGTDALGALEAELAPLRPEGLRVIGHAGEPLVYEPERELPGSMRSWLCFVDSAGALRVAWRFYGHPEELPEPLEHWLAVFREHAGTR